MLEDRDGQRDAGTPAVLSGQLDLHGYDAIERRPGTWLLCELSHPAVSRWQAAPSDRPTLRNRSDHRTYAESSMVE